MWFRGLGTGRFGGFGFGMGKLLREEGGIGLEYAYYKGRRGKLVRCGLG